MSKERPSPSPIEGILQGTLSHYRIVSPLGSGGMGAVYRARDEHLGRDVALKVLRASDVDDPTARARLVREAQMASSLNHPHVAHIYEVGEDRGRIFVAMELVEGHTLQSAIPPGGLSPAEVIRIGVQIADALAHAHARDVIHRDLKSTNVMLDANGRAKILDFGLAKRAATASPRQAEVDLSLTEPGVVMGTPNHLPPEVLRGEPADAQSDLWALGVVLYEMASGRMPFAGRSLADLAAAIVGREPLPLDPRVPPGLRAVIARCLAKDPGQRYARAGDVRAALEALGGTGAAPRGRRRLRRALVYGGAGALLGLLAALAWLPGGMVARLTGGGAPRAGTVARPAIHSLAVLPLANLSGDASQEYLADGMTEALITDLAPTPSLKVISRTSVMRFKGTQLTLPEIARQLGVDAIVEGSVFRVGDRVRVTAQLIHAASDAHLWARSFERDFREVLTLQSEVARDITREIRLELQPAVASQLAGQRPMNPEAYELYLRGRHAWSQATPGSLKEAIELFERAAALDPTDARYPSGIADVYMLQTQILGTIPLLEGMAKVKEYAKRALALDDQSAEAHASYSTSLLFGDWDVSGAEREIQRALELNPGISAAHLVHSVVLAATGRLEESIAANRRALELDPYSLINLWHGIITFRAARRYDEAQALSDRALAAYPGSPMVLEARARSYEQQGEFGQAMDQIDAMLASTPEGRTWSERLRKAYRESGPAGYWKVAIDFNRNMNRDPSSRAMSLAYLHASAGHKEQALDYLEEGLKAHVSDMMFLQVEPAFDGLRDLPRFQAIARQVGLR